MYRVLFFAVLAIASVVPSTEVAEREVDSPATDYCGWKSYGKPGFKDYYAELVATTSGCITMPNGGFRTALYSAKVSRGSQVCLWSKAGCKTGSHQVIDTAGYRDMTNLPEYDYWKCGPC